MSDDHEERRVGIYFGPSPYTLLTKEEVGEFIKNQMGLIRSDGGPKWTEGLTQLIELGMEVWRDGPEDISDIEKKVEQVNTKIDDYRDEILELSSQVEQKQSIDDLVDKAKQVHRTEARILEVLCRDENLGVKSPNYVSWSTVREKTNLEYHEVSYFARILANSQFSGFVEIDRTGNEIKAVDEKVFHTYCDERGLNPEAIRELNEINSSL